jgi:predicted O-linked N-acetylglucosamine transferase (SPINDLY family)
LTAFRRLQRRLPDADAYVALAAKLAGDADLRNSLRGRIDAVMATGPKFLDTKWYGEQVGMAFERIWKEHTVGKK